MPIDERHQIDPAVRLGCYLDGLLDDGQREAFERELQNDPQLRESLAQQMAVDASLKRLFPLPAESPATHHVFQLGRSIEQDLVRFSVDDLRLTTLAPSADAQIVNRKSSIVNPKTLARRLAIAALFIVTAYTAWSAWLVIRPQPSPELAQLSPAQYYAKKQAAFTPYWVCENDEQFASCFRDRFNQALLLKPLPEDLHANGLDYVNCISQQTIALLVRAEGREIIVLVDRQANDSAKLSADTAPDPELRLFRRQIGALVLYEITPFDSPRVLEHFYDPDQTT